ncbi:hypothetical protein [Streptomyces sp. NBC_01268]|uniref:hypothetical protein n=1 Tax=Streptomyces sp. NBC_01268 TaxID=2903806 RepID=UPI002E3536CE|nr:hypothetical protein [Streptomyces sp. NBC_01268]
MSTTTTGADPGRTPRRARFGVPFPRGAGRGAGRIRQAEDLTVQRRVQPATETRHEGRLRRRANRRGRKAAGGRYLNPWILGSGDRVPYFAELASVRDLLHARIAEEHAREEHRLSTQRALARGTAENADQEIRRLDRQLAENAAWLVTNREQLDQLAARSVRWERYRDRVRELVEGRRLQDRFDGTADDDTADDDTAGRRAGDGRGDGDGRGAGSGHGDGAASVAGGASADGRTVPPESRPAGRDDAASEAPSADEEEDYQNLDEDAETAAPPAADTPPGRGSGSDPLAPPDLLTAASTQTDIARWPGLQSRPGLPDWMVAALLVVVAAVEVPIYWMAFQPFHGVGSTGADTLTGTLAVSAALVMVVVPHLAGRALRGSSGTGASKWANLPALALLGAWGFSTWALAHLRTKLVFRSSPAGSTLSGVRDLDAQRPTSLLGSLHLEQTTVTWMFVALLVLSGGIGLLTGLLREHPALDTYRSHVEESARLQREREAATVRAQRARATAASVDEGSELRADASRQRQRATTSLYESVAHAYLMGVAEGSSDPAVTEAAMRLSNTWPLVPFAAVRERPAG